jgi:hypothetical protein
LLYILQPAPAAECHYEVVVYLFIADTKDLGGGVLAA